MTKNMIKKIPAYSIRDGRHALELSIEIWKELVYRPDGTTKDDVVAAGYWCNCPLCQYYIKTMSSERESYLSCRNCPINRAERYGGCFKDREPYKAWESIHTAETAKEVLKQLEKAHEDLYQLKEGK